MYYKTSDLSCSQVPCFYICPWVSKKRKDGPRKLPRRNPVPTNIRFPFEEIRHAKKEMKQPNVKGTPQSCECRGFFFLFWSGRFGSFFPSATFVMSLDPNQPTYSATCECTPAAEVSEREVASLALAFWRETLDEKHTPVEWIDFGENCLNNV